MYKHKLFLLPVAWLLAFMALACAPPDDDAPSSGPTINNAIYDVGMALLTVQGNHLSPTEAQIQTIKVYGVVLNSYTADDDATGLNSNGLEQGKYRIKGDGTAIWLKLTDKHKATLEAKVDSNGLKKGLLTSSGAWAGLDTPKDLDVMNVPDKQSKVSDDNQPSKQTEEAEEAEQVEQAEEESRKLPEAEESEEESPKQPKDEQVEQQSPELPEAEQTEQVEDQQSKTETEEAAITRATYHVGTALLTLQGTHLASATQAQIQTITVDGIALDSYTADGTATGPDSRSLAKGKYRIKGDGTAIWLYLTDQHKATLNGKPGMDSNGLKDGLLSVGTGTWAGLDTAKALAVSGHPPAITSATYNANTGVLVITGTNLPKAVAGWDFSKLRFRISYSLHSYTLPQHATTGANRAEGSAASATSLTITLSGRVKAQAEAEDMLSRNGLTGITGGAYNLEAAAGFAGGRAADTSNNPITVSGYASQISRVDYYADRGELRLYGDNLPSTVADWDFSKLALVSGDGSKRYTLPRHATAGENTATGKVVLKTVFFITLSGSVKAEANKILVKNGESDDAGAYNLEAAAGFIMGSPADTTTSILVSGW